MNTILKEENNNIFKDISEMSKKSKRHILLIGDMNCKEIDWETSTTNIADKSHHSNQFLDITKDCFLEQAVSKETRLSG